MQIRVRMRIWIHNPVYHDTDDVLIRHDKIQSGYFSIGTEPVLVNTFKIYLIITRIRYNLYGSRSNPESTLFFGGF
jgi:hypothetical protein